VATAGLEVYEADPRLLASPSSEAHVRRMRCWWCGRSEKSGAEW